jgi:hypothetical protein
MVAVVLRSERRCMVGAPFGLEAFVGRIAGGFRHFGLRLILSLRVRHGLEVYPMANVLGLLTGASFKVDRDTVFRILVSGQIQYGPRNLAPLK